MADEPEHDGKSVIFMTTGLDTPQCCATPYYMANLSGVVDKESIIVHQIDGVLLMKKGVAENLKALEGGALIIDFIRDAKEAGVKMYCCSSALSLHGMTPDDLIEECDGVIGGAWMINESDEADFVLCY